MEWDYSAGNPELDKFSGSMIIQPTSTDNQWSVTWLIKHFSVIFYFKYTCTCTCRFDKSRVEKKVVSYKTQVR